MKYKKFDLQNRLIQFAITTLQIAEQLPKSYIGQHFAKQLTRSGTSPAFQYGEAQAAESRKDFVHKLKIGLKELRETYICLTIIKQKPLLKSEILDSALAECDELISIVFTSIATANRNMRQ